MISTSDFDISKIVGLSEKEADERLKEDGPNEIPSTRRRSRLILIWEMVTEPMIGLLLIGVIIYAILGEISDAAILAIMILVVVAITFFQENKTEKALEALRDLSSPRALVIRDKKQIRLAGREVVRGDIFIVSEGDRVPADAVLLFSSNLAVDESLLTGESVSVRKSAQDGLETGGQPGGEDTPFIFSSTLVVKGRGVARVFATGINTEIGKIGKAIKAIEPEKTTIQKEVNKVIKIFAAVSLAVCLIAAVVYGLRDNNWLEGALFGIAVAISLLPEEIPMVLTIYLALGAWRMTKKNVLTRRFPVIEMLGAVNILCVDKTGTLTMNKMHVKKMMTDGEIFEVHHKLDNLPEKFHEILEYSVLSSQPNPFDPMETALRDLGSHFLKQTDHWHDNWAWVKEYPLSSSLLATSHVWKAVGRSGYTVAIKGAPETIAKLCGLSENQTKNILENTTNLAKDGLRVLGVAKAHFENDNELLPKEQTGFNFHFIGLVGLADPVRLTVPPALEECYKAGIRVVMITGDYPDTAKSIAKQAGLRDYEYVVTGAELEKMDDHSLEKIVQSVNVFARVVPEQKLRLVKAFKNFGQIVAMTGDGVNDAPALKSAHIGIAMGGRGTDVAREASSLVLLDDDFSSIVKAVRSGRRIFDNLKKAMAYIISVHVPVAGLALVPLFFNWPMVFTPIHIIFLELIIDPACSLIFEGESEEPQIMDRPPRDIKEPLFNKKLSIFGFFQGLIVLFIVLGVLGFSWNKGLSEAESRTLTFASLVVAYLGLIINNLSWKNSFKHVFKTPNKALKYILTGSLIFLILIIYFPPLRNLFHFSSLHLSDLGIVFLAGFFNVLFFESFKLFQRLRSSKSLSLIQ